MSIWHREQQPDTGTYRQKQNTPRLNASCTLGLTRQQTVRSCGSLGLHVDFSNPHSGLEGEQHVSSNLLAPRQKKNHIRVKITRVNDHVGHKMFVSNSTSMRDANSIGANMRNGTMAERTAVQQAYGTQGGMAKHEMKRRASVTHEFIIKDIYYEKTGFSGLQTTCSCHS